MTERLGIEIDYCPQCRGVWLDRGELDKILDRSMGDFVQKAPVAQVIHQAPSQYDRGHDNYDKHHDNHQGYREKKSIWKELFD
jgi:Zn-finger nucleic acid-binding protein